MSTSVGLEGQRQLSNYIIIPVGGQVSPPVLSSAKLWLHGSQRWAGWLWAGSSKYVENVVTAVAAAYLNLSLGLLRNKKN